MPDTDIEVIVPWLGGCEYRERAWSWVRGRLPYSVRVAEGGEPWVKARAVMPAVVASSAEIVCVHDADVWCPGLEQAVEAVREGRSWAMPHGDVHRLTEIGTAAVLAGQDWRLQRPLAQFRYPGVPGGGCVVARREALLEVPLDPRFVGWGQEDESWGMALRAVLGAPKRISEPLVHLYHPPQERPTRTRGSDANVALRRRYIAARTSPTRMRLLLNEISRESAFERRRGDQRGGRPGGLAGPG